MQAPRHPLSLFLKVASQTLIMAKVPRFIKLQITMYKKYVKSNAAQYPIENVFSMKLLTIVPFLRHLKKRKGVCELYFLPGIFWSKR